MIPALAALLALAAGIACAILIAHITVGSGISDNREFCAYFLVGLAAGACSAAALSRVK